MKGKPASCHSQKQSGWLWAAGLRCHHLAIASRQCALSPSLLHPVLYLTQVLYSNLHIDSLIRFYPSCDASWVGSPDHNLRFQFTLAENNFCHCVWVGDDLPCLWRVWLQCHRYLLQLRVNLGQFSEYENLRNLRKPPPEAGHKLYLHQLPKTGGPSSGFCEETQVDDMWTIVLFTSRTSHL